MLASFLVPNDALSCGWGVGICALIGPSLGDDILDAVVILAIAALGTVVAAYTRQHTTACALMVLTMCVQTMLPVPAGRSTAGSESSDDARPLLAICYWGLTRSTRAVYTSHNERVKAVIQHAQLSHRVYLHTWILDGPQYVQGLAIPKQTPANGKELFLLRPYRYARDRQAGFVRRLPAALAKQARRNRLVLNWLCGSSWLFGSRNEPSGVHRFGRIAENERCNHRLL